MIDKMMFLVRSEPEQEQETRDGSLESKVGMIPRLTTYITDLSRGESSIVAVYTEFFPRKESNLNLTK